ncbi:DUF885 domain-containing protein [Winogradskya humida]|uniref:DUF885 domain-containing protein n=1 Tax=Winogradskya humida TaxID=113566 RepID=A0ABQ4A172_9ACTN|nr:DUF885 domain-containing protein [Actinoplanes humidus]GIE24583.1 hypothetical protein Ahu01nite_076850 [Actinoplanes humidus]
MNAPEPVVRDYLQLGLRMGRLVDGYVDCYFGEPAPARQVADEPRPHPGELAAEARRLLRELDAGALEPDRSRFLAGQLRAVECCARRLDGAELPFVAELEACFDVTVELGETDRYAEVHDAMAALLPGAAPLAERLDAFRARDSAARDRLGEAVGLVAAELRTRARAAFPLPEAEGTEFTVVTDAPWNAFNDYRGDFRSHVSLNAAGAHGLSAVPILATHEAYPGHHTERCVKEAHLVRVLGQAEHSITLVNTPQCLIAEGTAEQALEILLDDQWGAWNTRLLAGIGIDIDGVTGARLWELTRSLLGVRQDAALLLHAHGAGEDDVVAYLRRWMLLDEVQARHTVRFLTHPLWRAYTTTYAEGSRLVGAWLAVAPPGTARLRRYGRLLSEPLLPTQLRQELTGARPDGRGTGSGQPRSRPA